MMSHSEGNSEVQVPRPSQAFPFGPISTPPQPHINQWCRFSIPERLPLKPFRQDRLHRLPLPPALMATAKVDSPNELESSAASVGLTVKQAGGIDPLQKIQQLEKNLVFVRENHALLLRGLHEEIAELKQKNRELLFELVTGVTLVPKDVLEEKNDRDSPEELQDKIDKLEKEVRKLRSSLKDAMKTNSSLTNQLQELKRDQYNKHSSRHKIYTPSPSDSAVDDEHPVHSPAGPSPQMEEYSDTLRQIQRATSHRSGKREDRYHHVKDGGSEWLDTYNSRSNNGYQHQRHHQHRNHPQRSPRQQQARLPRLPLRNQQNYSHPQYEIQYHQRSTNALPALKPFLPVMDHRIDKPRKPRGPRPAKIADQVTNG